MLMGRTARSGSASPRQGSGTVGMSKHRKMGHPGVSSRVKLDTLRAVQALAPRRRAQRMYSSMRDLMSGRD